MDALEEIQTESRIYFLACLFQESRQRFLMAADLLKVQNETVSQVKASGRGERVDPRHLNGAYAALCRRYRSEIHSPQMEPGVTFRD